MTTPWWLMSHKIQRGSMKIFKLPLISGIGRVVLQPPFSVTTNHQVSQRRAPGKFICRLTNVSSYLMDYHHSAPSNLSLPKATASTIVHKPRGLSKGWFEKEGPAALASNSQDLQHTPPASPGEDHHPEHPLAPKQPQVWPHLPSIPVPY